MSKTIDNVASGLKYGIIKRKPNGKYYYHVPTSIRRSGEIIVTKRQIDTACKKYNLEIIGFSGHNINVRQL